MEENLLIYQPNVINTYLYFVRENFILIKNISDENGNLVEPYNPSKKETFYSSRAKHIQIMTLLGLTAEHLLKLILLKKGFILNSSNIEIKFNETLMAEIEQNKDRELTQEELNYLYNKSKGCIGLNFKKELKSFDECVHLFKEFFSDNYYTGLGTYILNPRSENDSDANTYLGFNEIKPNKALKVIQKMRNSYLHLAEAQNEQQGVVWYLFNFLIWLANKEYPEFFKNIEYIGNEEIRRLFQND